MSGARFPISRRHLLAGAAALPFVAARGSAFAASDPEVDTAEGRVRGIRENGVLAFKGIRYGEDTARYRFRAPVAAKPWNSVQSAQAFAPICPQRRAGSEPTSEDCLFLNVWTPEAHPRAKRPVMVYFHGGAYSNGTVTDPLTHGQHLAAGGDVVVVTINHRLNALGYLYLAEFDKRFADSGNLGQLDLILGLQWVRRNIAAFGGDPTRVMVFGQSGGGAKIATLMGMPAAKGLFHTAATMSGQQVTASGPGNAVARTRAYLSTLGLSDEQFASLLDIPVEKLVEGLQVHDPILGGSLYFGPVLDMKWLTRHPFWPDANPQSTDIPMILGNTREETRAFIDPRGDKLKGLDWGNIAARMRPELKIDLDPDWIVKSYREEFPDWGPVELFYRATTAGRSWPGQVIEADARAAAGAKRTWVYQLDHDSPVDPLRKAAHTDDIPFVFGTLAAEGSYSGTGEAQRKLSRQMMGAFVALARSGDPNHAGLPEWPHYELPERATMRFGLDTRAENDPRRFERELFARAPYIQPGS